MAVRAAIQVITVVWTKQSRSGNSARARATVPKALPFKFQPGIGIPVHSVLFRNGAGFEVNAEETENLPPPHVWKGPRIASKGPRIGLNLRLKEGDGRLEARLRQSRYLRPTRPHLTSYSLVASLPVGELARIVINFRFSGFSLAWHFSQTVINIAFGHPPAPGLFDDEPSRVADLRLPLGW